MRDYQPLRGDGSGVLDAGRHKHWDAETDVVVVGLGGAGGSAAIEARTGGARVLLVDRFGGGGATTRSAGAIYFGGGTDLQRHFGYQDSPENMFKYLRLETEDAVPEATLRDFCERSVENFEWLRRLGCPFPVSGQVVKAALPPDDCTLYFSGNELCKPYSDAAVPAPRGHRPLGKGLTGHLAASALRAGAIDTGAELRMFTRAERLVVDADGEVLGVVLCQMPRWAAAMGEALQEMIHYGGSMLPRTGNAMGATLRAVERAAKRTFVRARRGVVLATGGFIFNPTLMQDHAPDYAACSMRLGTAGDDGAGIAMGEAAGGFTAQMDRCSAPRFIDPPHTWLRGVLVGRNGERICNETLYGGKVGDNIVKDHGGHGTLIVDARTMATGRGQLLGPDLYVYQRIFGFINGYVACKSASTLRGLAEKFGIDPEPLEATVRAYNDGVASGSDALGKSGEHLGAVRQAPFYGIPFDNTSMLFPAPCMTLGGLRTEGDTSRVMRRDGTPIDGLYAVGRTAVGVASNGYASGLSVSDGIFAGRIAGAHAAARTETIRSANSIPQARQATR